MPSRSSPDELYALTAYILFLNDVTKDPKFELNDKTLASVKMPNAEQFYDDDREKTEKRFWNKRPCMKDCKKAVEILAALACSTSRRKARPHRGWTDNEPVIRRALPPLPSALRRPCCLSTSASSSAADLALGRHLSAECVTCHPRDSRSRRHSRDHRLAADQFVAVLKSYKAKERDNPVMQSVAASLSDEEMAALAAYFDTLKPGG